jgi:hypothetical protein
VSEGILMIKAERHEESRSPASLGVPVRAPSPTA